MIKKIKYCLAALLLFPWVPMAQAFGDSTALSNDRRDKAIQREMDCVSQHLQKDGVTWDDVCYMVDTQPSGSSGEDRMDVINRQLDRVQGQGQDQNAPEEVKQQLAEDGAYPMISDSLSPESSAPQPASDWYDVDENAKKPSNIRVVSKKHEFSISKEYYYAKYEEPEVMHQEGNLSGYNLNYTYRPTEKDPFYFKQLDVYHLRGQWASGKFYYSSNTTGTMDGKGDKTYEIAGTIGKDFYPSNEVRTTSYGGFGYRYLLDKSEGRFTSTGNFGYDRISNYYFLPLGVDVVYQTNPNYHVEGNFEFDYLARGKQISKLGYVSGYDNLVHTQSHGYGLRTSIKLVRNFKYMDIFGEGFIRYWNIEDSEVINNTLEPHNITEEFGLRFGVSI